ncbi:MAG: iron-containing alcohol dehydrogenase [Firmicutes bacterium]|nr:iron-containing alcohol dehydrogenase [Bacillota bacterium]
MGVFQLQVPTQVRFGAGRAQELVEVLAQWQCERAFLVTDPAVMATSGVERAVQALTEAGIEVALWDRVMSDPTLDSVHQAAEAFARSGAAGLVAVGGGSAIDTAKGIRVLASAGGRLADYAGPEGKAFCPRVSIPVVALPTTAGTGSEVTFFGVYSDPARHLKVTVTSPHLAPEVAIVDPELTRSLPPIPTAQAGIDVLGHAIEAYVSRAASAVSDLFAERAIGLVARHLPVAVADGANETAREGMAEASLLAGIAFNHAGLGLTHAIAAALSGAVGLAHGAAIGLLLPAVAEYNWPAAPQKLARVAELLGRPATSGAALGATIRALDQQIGIPTRLKEVGVTEGMLPEMARATALSVQLRFNPRQPTEAEVVNLLRAIW